MCHQMYQGTIFQPFSGVLSRMPYNYFLVEAETDFVQSTELLRREAIVENETVWIDSPFTGLGGCFAHRVVNDFHPACGEQNNVEFLSLSRFRGFPVLAFSAPKPVHFVQSPIL